MTMLELLEAALRTIQEEKHWVQSTPAVMADGTRVTVHDLRAVAWCVTGALERAAGTDYGKLNIRARRALLNTPIAQNFFANVEPMYRSVEEINDEVTHPDMLRLFAQAIEMTRGVLDQGEQNDAAKELLLHAGRT